MPVIDSVEREKGASSRYRICLDSGRVFSVHEDTLIRHRLLKGQEISRDTLEQILIDEEWQDAYRASIRYIGRRPHSAQEVREKLITKGFEPSSVQSVIDKLSEQKYIDDRQFAAMWTQHRMLSQKKGRKLVQFELRQKGLTEQQISDALGEVNEDIETEKAYSLLRKRGSSLSGDDSHTIRRKLVNYLLRRGYTQSVSLRAFHKWNEEQSETP